MRRKTAIFTAFSGALLLGLAVGITAGPVEAGLRDDVARCAAIADAAARLACFDTLAADTAAGGSAAAEEAAAALKEEFRFQPRLMTGPFGFHLAVSGKLRIARDTEAARAVERLVRRISNALSDSDGWGVSVTVHGASVALSRDTPYSGEELFAQAKEGLARSGLDPASYELKLGPDAEPVLWDDGRVRSANEHIIVRVTGFDSTLTQ